jgi:hypothetical protein
VAGAAHEGLQQRELARRQVDLRVAPPDLSRGRVQAQVADLQHGRALDRPAPRQRAQTREQLGQREGLGQVVVGALIQPVDAIVDGVARREHDDRHPQPVGAQPTARLEAVDVGEHDVEDHGVVVGRPHHPQRVRAADGDVGHDALGAQAAAQRGRHAHVVLHHQHLHRLRIISAHLRAS